MKKRLLLVLLLCGLIIVLNPFVLAHPGRTDANGGHYDRSTGEYHYHHGYSAHQHPDGVCPYEFDDKTGKDSGTSTSKQPVTEIPDDTPPAVANTPDNTNDSLPNTWGIIALISTFSVAVMALILCKKHKKLSEAEDYCVQMEQLKQDQAAQMQEMQLQMERMRRELAEAQEKVAQCNQFVRSFGPSAEKFFSSADVEPRLCRMAADYLTMVYDASADYLESKNRPAYTEARRIRELKEETKLWIERATRAEYRLQEAQNRKLLSPPEK